MNTHKLKPAIEYILTAPTNVDGVDAQLDAAWVIYDAEVTPSTVLCMLSDNERLKVENEALLKALKGMDSMYGHCWDLVDGGLLCMQNNVQRFEEAHEAAQKVITAMSKEAPDE